MLDTKALLTGLLILTVNIGSRFIAHEWSSNDEEYQQYIIVRRLAIFAACYMGTGDLVVSMILTAAFVVLAGGLFRGKSDYAKEGMANQADAKLRANAGLKGTVDAPAYSAF